MEQTVLSNTSDIRAAYTQDDDICHQLLKRRTELIDARENAYRTLQGAARLDHVAAIDAELKTLKPRIERAEVQLKNSETGLRALASTRFSDDIWRHVFDLATSAPVDLQGFILPGRRVVMHGAGAPYALASVCRVWRALVLATPSLWANFHSSPLSFKSGIARRWRRVLAALQLQLERSASSPLNVTIDIQRGTDGAHRSSSEVDAAETMFQVLGGHASRWQHIDLNLENCAPRRVLEAVAACIATAEAPMLRTLRVMVMRSTWHTVSSTPTALPRGCLMLQNLTIGGNPIEAIPTGSLSALTTLHLKLTGWDVLVLWDILRVAPLLDTLRLSGWSGQLEPPVALQHKPSPCARLRRLEVNAGGMRCIRTLANHLDLSCVQEFVVRSPANFAWDRLVDEAVLQSFRESVTKLVIRRGRSEELGEDWARQFGALHRVREFHDEDGGTRNDFWETVDEEDLWPQLEIVRSTTRPNVKIPVTRIPALEALGELIAHRKQRSGQGVRRIREVYVDAEDDTREWLAGLVAE